MRTSRGRGRTRRLLAMLVSLLTIAGSLVLLAEPSFGLGEPTIAFLNPSSFAVAGEKGVIVSDAKPDVGPGLESVSNSYRLSAWTANAPLGARVFFAVTQRAIDIEIPGSEASGSDGTWEANWSIPPEILDGPATVNVYLVIGEEAVAVAEQDVTIMRTQERTELSYPQTGGAFGSYAPLASELPAAGAARKLPMGIVDAPYSDSADITYVRTFYTTSAPGTKPTWSVCGTEGVGTTSNSLAGNGVRCQLKSANDQTAITAMAAIANDSPDEYDDRFNESGDAVPVSQPYAQQPTSFVLETDGSQRVEKEAISGKFYCSRAEAILLSDQLGRQVAGANIDVHASGPNDQLAFNTFSILTTNQPPDRGAHTTEVAFDCTGQNFQGSTSPPGNANPSEQGEHPRFGLPDRKHIESLGGGTSDIGRFTFSMHSPVKGVTNWTAWVDETDDGCHANDDAFTQDELSLNGSIGWEESADQGLSEPFDLFVPCTPANPGPTPEPTPAEGPGGGQDGSREISLELEETPKLGQPARFSGRIVAARAACEMDQAVVLKVRKPGKRFWTLARGATDEQGRFTLKAKARAPRDYRAIAPGTASCDRAKSQAVRLRAQ